MARPIRNRAQREADLVTTARLYLRGTPQQAIADRLGISRPQVSYDLKQIQERWRQSALVDISEAKARELAKIDELERTYWQAWKRSMKESHRIVKSSSENSKGGEDGLEKSYTASETTEQHVGNPAFLAGVEWCIDKRCKLFGLDAPQKLDINWREEALRDGMKPDDVDTLFENLIEAAMGRRDEIGGDSGSATPTSDSTTTG